MKRPQQFDLHALAVFAITVVLGDIPRLTAALCKRVLQEKTFPPLIGEYPWMAQQLVWPSAADEAAELIA